MSAVATLTLIQKQNANTLVSRCIFKGITNLFSQGAMLSIALKESGLNPFVKEVSYKNTANSRIRKIFTITKALSDTQLNALKNNEVAFFNFVYNGVAGNGVNDGYKFRGRGYNDLTGRGNYRAIGKKIGVDLEANPDLLSTDITIATDAFIQYFIDRMILGKQLGKLKLYNSTGINDFKTLNDSLGAFYHANAGWGHSVAQIQSDPTGGLAKAKSTITDFYALVSKGIQNNKTATGGGLFFLILTILAISKRKQISAWISQQTKK